MRSKNLYGLISTTNAKFPLQFGKRLSGRFHSPCFGCRNAYSNRLHGFQPLKPLKNALITFGILNYKFGLAIYCKHQGSMRLFHLIHEVARVPLEIC